MKQIEIAFQLAINARQQIQVERRCNSRGVIVRAHHLFDRLHQVGAQQERITRRKDVTDIPQEILRRTWIKVSNRTIQKQHQQALILGATACCPPETVEIFRFNPRTLTPSRWSISRSHASNAECESSMGQ